MHSYHCSCEYCSPDPDRENPLHAQEDCTVEGEIITKPLVYGSREADRTIAGLASALTTGRGQPGEGAGFHVHVEHNNDEVALVRLYRMFLRYQTDLAELASGQWGQVRDYNSPLTADRMVFTGPRTLLNYCGGTICNNRTWRTLEAARMACEAPRRDSFIRLGNEFAYYCPGHRVTTEGLPRDAFWTAEPAELTPHFNWPHKESWLAKREQTVEFRLWNSTRLEWRMRLAVGVSVAMVNAAVDGENVTENDERTLTSVLVPYLDSDTLAGVLRQSHYIEEVRTRRAS